MNCQRKVWDSLAEESRDAPLRAVISRNDIHNYYVDRTQKAIFSRVVKLKESCRVLDVGCGVGRWSLWLAPQVGAITGVDISPKMIEIAQKRASSQGLGNTTFLVIDGTSLPFKDREFDFVLGCWLLKYITHESEVKQMIDEMCRITRSDGHLAIVEEVDDNGPVFLNRPDFDGQSVLRPSSYYVSLFAKCGARLIDYAAITPKIPLFPLYSGIRKKMGIWRYKKTDQYLLNIIINAQVLLDLLTRRRKLKRGHCLFYFQKVD